MFLHSCWSIFNFLDVWFDSKLKWIQNPFGKGFGKKEEKKKEARTRPAPLPQRTAQFSA